MFWIRNGDVRSFIAVAMIGLLSLAGLVGCASSPSERDVLKQRAEARWGAVIRGELDKAYLFLTPEHRNVVSLQQYKAKFGRTIEWRVAEVDEIRYDDPTVASVLMGVTYRVFMPGARGEHFESRKVLTEKWLLKDGEWWYTDQ